LSINYDDNCNKEVQNDNKDHAIAYTSKKIEDLFAIASLYLGKHWQIDHEEAESIAKPAVKCIEMTNPRLKQVIQRYSAPGSLLLSVAIVIIPRLLITIRSNHEFRLEKDQERVEVKQRTTNEGKTFDNAARYENTIPAPWKENQPKFRTSSTSPSPESN
jgi:hypothetical protein